MLKEIDGETLDDTDLLKLYGSYCVRGCGRLYSETNPAVCVKTKRNAMLWWCAHPCTR